LFCETKKAFRNNLKNFVWIPGLVSRGGRLTGYEKLASHLLFGEWSLGAIAMLVKTERVVKGKSMEGAEVARNDGRYQP